MEIVPGGVEDMDHLLDMFFKWKNILDHHTLAQHGLKVEVDQRWTHLPSSQVEREDDEPAQQNLLVLETDCRSVTLIS